MNNIDLGLLQSRNVQVYNSCGAVLAGFWQYGTLRWDDFYHHMNIFASTKKIPWMIFQYDPTQYWQHGLGEPCPPGADIVPPGSYILLSDAGNRVEVFIATNHSRPRNLIHSSTPAEEAHYEYEIRACARDKRCLITGLQTATYSRLKVAHIFPQGHDAEWMRKGYPSRITDIADEAVMGGPTKINSVQNLITLRGDLYDAWENYEYGVDPKNNYRITAFTNGYEDINGRFLQLDHIKDSTLRPLDELLMDHFIQGLYKHMKGVGDVSLSTYEDEDLSTYEDEDDITQLDYQLQLQSLGN